MIERQTIDGRDATIAYLTDKFAPATADTAQYVKVVFDDGEMFFLLTGIPPAASPPPLPFAPHRKHHRLLRALASRKPHNWPTFTGKAKLVGTSPAGKVSVYYDATLGAQALQNAQDLLIDADRIVANNDIIFGVTGEPVDVLIMALDGATDGSGGADHMGCTFATGNKIEVCASFGNSMRCSALFEAELSENCMNDNLCGFSTGEALSRWCAAAISNNALSDFASVSTWAQNGYANWVDTTEPTDMNEDSTGCGMAFISWLLKQGYTLPKIAQSMVSFGDSGTFAQLYGFLTGKDPSGAWASFLPAIRAISFTSDDPFNALGSAQLKNVKTFKTVKTVKTAKTFKTFKTFKTAIVILDKSEIEIRDLIERDLQNIAGVSGTKYGNAMRVVDKLMAKIKRVRLEAIKASFRHIRDHSS